MKDMVAYDFGVNISTSTISDKLIGVLYTVEQIAEGRMEILERVAKRNISCMDLRLVSKMALHCQNAVAAAEHMEGMQYGT
ncbi:uncharacterized protein IUM83_14106 [Phytophthora cinnamomi]|uniref:uncharacterized protein n=1 Tax=Phytophthora cinnamomi TaxID=4785 RepID=UPI00355ABE97|nr:hypothetical protein IUM83_14106 [Phytophthora cinnamomi]